MPSAAAFSWDLHEARVQLVGERSLFSVSEIYHENSKIVAAAPGIAHTAEALAVGSDGFKRYVYSPAVELPPPISPTADLGSLLRQRKSARSYSPAPMTIQQIADLAHAASGLTGPRRRPAPSAGGLFPVELYVVSLNVDGLPGGVYHYDVRAHRLDEIAPGDHRPTLDEAIFIEEAVAQASIACLLTAVFGRSKIKYGERAYRFALLEAGHIMQNLLLTAGALGLGACPVGGFVDDILNDLLAVDGVEEAVVYSALVGT